MSIGSLVEALWNRLLGSYIRRVVVAEMAKFTQRRSLEVYRVFGDESRLTVARTAIVNNALFNLSSGTITVEDYAFFGHNVCLLTGTHDYAKRGLDRQAAIPESGRDIVVGRGAWVASNATVLGPCVIGENAVVAACSLVCGDVAPNVVVAGVPAKVVSALPNDTFEPNAE